ncbi:MAG TPA: tetratricopeptide repeat protein [Pyrinomonadaceae bacterium]|nr:tetratricopeptide repeat protein [Pyrinomonadaceae bacterium]
MKRTHSILVALPLVLASAVVLHAQNVQKAVDDQMGRAIADMQRNDLSKAIADITEAIKLKPDYGDGYLLRSSFRAMTGDIDGALADLGRVIELMPSRGQTHFERATLRLAKNDVAGAMADLDLAVSKGYKTDGVYSMRAQLRWQREDLKGALSDLDASITLNPNNPRSYATRGQMRLILEDKTGAFSDLNYLLTWYENPRPQPSATSTAQSSKAATFQRPANDVAAKPSQEKKDLATVVGIDVETSNESPNDKEMAQTIAAAYQHRGLIYSARGNIDGAISDYNKSIQVMATDWAVFYNRAVEREKKGDLEGAMNDVNKAIELDPNNGNARLEHGVILTLQGKNTEAQGDFEMLLNAAPAYRARIDKRLEAARKSYPGKQL